MTIFEFNDYRTYLRQYIRHLPRKGRGELSKIAQHLRVNTTLISQIMSGLREFNPEQALLLSEYLAHSEAETEYFSLLIQRERAGTVELRRHLDKKIVLLKNEALKLSKRISHEKKLTDQERAVFYSSWIYSAVHLFTSTREKGVTLDDIVARFGIKKNVAAEIVRFLVSAGLCIERSGTYTMGVQSTFVERGSPYVLKHYSNWRINAIRRSETLLDGELMYSGQFSISRSDFEKLREEITDFLKRANQLVKDSKAEDIANLNIDWFWIEPN